MTKIGTPESIGEANKKLILDQLRLKGSMSRADLTRETRMSFPAVSSNTRCLLEKGYILESGASDNSVGRKSKLSSFNVRRGFVIGIDIGRHEIRFMLADLLGVELATRIREHKLAETGCQIVSGIADVAKKLVKDAGIGNEDVLTVCVGIPGIIHNDQMSAAPIFQIFSSAI